MHFSSILKRFQLQKFVSDIACGFKTHCASDRFVIHYQNLKKTELLSIVVSKWKCLMLTQDHLR